MRSNNEKSKINMLKSHQSTTHDIAKKEMTLQRQANKQYLKFKKSASQPAYFLNKSRLKRLSDIYRAVSLQKIVRHSSFHNSNSKSIYQSITPEKKNSGLLNNSSSNNNFSVKKNNKRMNTLNLNNIFQTAEKTKRLTLNRPNPKTDSVNNFFETQNQISLKMFLAYIDRLQQISHLTFQKMFLNEYNNFFENIKDEEVNKNKNNLNKSKTLISKFCTLIDYCEHKKLKIKQKQIKSKYQKIQLQYSNSITELKKKSFKMELLIKQLDQIKSHNLKLSKDINDLKQQKKNLLTLKSINSRKIKIETFQITQVLQLMIKNQQNQIKTPVYQYNINTKGSIKSDGANSKFQNIQLSNKIKNDNQQHNNNENENDRKDKLDMIKKIRKLQKKQKDLMKTLLVLRADGIDVQRAFQEVLSGENVEVQVQDDSLQFTKKTQVPRYIRKIKNKDSFQADSSLIQSIEGLSIRYIEGEVINEEDIFFPLKHQYKSKPLPVDMQNRLKLDFNVLYEDYQFCDDTQNEDDNEDIEDSDTG